MINSLFKFCHISSYTKDNLVENTLLFKDPKTYNDPFEMNYMLVDKANYSAPDIGHDLQTRQKQLNKELSDNYHVYCLCESRPDEQDSLLMWAYYADEHKGLAIEFDYNSLTKTFKYPPEKVEYFDSLPHGFDDTGKSQLVKVSKTKSSHWAHEKEHRFLIPKLISSQMQGRDIGVGRLLYHEPTAIKGIYFGLRVDMDQNQTAKDIYNIASNRSIPVYEMVKSTTHYSLSALLLPKEGSFRTSNGAQVL